MIIYHGSKYRVEKQLKCKHIWHGPCISRIARFMRCKECGVMDWDFNSEDEYWKVMEREEDESYLNRERRETKITFQNEEEKGFWKLICLAEIQGNEYSRSDSCTELADKLIIAFRARKKTSEEETREWKAKVNT